MDSSCTSTGHTNLKHPTITGELLNGPPELRAASGNAAAPTDAASGCKPPSAIARSTLEGDLKNLDNPAGSTTRLALL